jgi:hypothetical protein
LVVQKDDQLVHQKILGSVRCEGPHTLGDQHLQF